MNDGPLIVQSDKTLLLEVDHPNAEAARRAIAPFAELERAPEHVHTYRITPARPVERPRGRARRRAGRRRPPHATAGMPSPTPCSSTWPTRWTATAGSRLEKEGIADSEEGTRLVLRTTDRPVLEEVLRHKKIKPLTGERIDDLAVRRAPERARARSSRSCSRSAGRPRTSPATSTARRTPSSSQQDGWHLRPYQQQAVDGFWHGGSGVVVLPCGAGKTLVGAGAMARGQGHDAHPRHEHRAARGSGRTSCSSGPR